MSQVLIAIIAKAAAELRDKSGSKVLKWGHNGDIIFDCPKSSIAKFREI